MSRKGKSDTEVGLPAAGFSAVETAHRLRRGKLVSEAPGSEPRAIVAVLWTARSIASLAASLR